LLVCFILSVIKNIAPVSGFVIKMLSRLSGDKKSLKIIKNPVHGNHNSV